MPTNADLTHKHDVETSDWVEYDASSSDIL